MDSLSSVSVAGEVSSFLTFLPFLPPFLAVPLFFGALGTVVLGFLSSFFGGGGGSMGPYSCSSSLFCFGLPNLSKCHN